MVYHVMLRGMMKKQTIKFTIGQDGTVTEEVIGTEGTQCINLTEHIEKIDHAHIDDIGEIHGDVVTHPKQF